MKRSYLAVALVSVILLAGVVAWSYRPRTVSLEMMAYPGGTGENAHVHLVFVKPSSWYIHLYSPELAGRLKTPTPVTTQFVVRGKSRFHLDQIGDWSVGTAEYGVNHGCGPEKRLPACKADNTYDLDTAPWFAAP